jgi:transposase
MATEALLAHVLVNKYADHLPLYRQTQIFARQGDARVAGTIGPRAPIVLLVFWRPAECS